MAYTQAPESRFAYVVIASRRARQLQSGARPLIDLPRSRKPTRMAIEELQKGLLEFELPDSIADPEGKEEKRRKG